MKFPIYTAYPGQVPLGFRTVRRRITHQGGGGDFELDAAALTQGFSFGGGLPPGGRLFYWRSKIATLASGGGVGTLAAAIVEGSNIPYAFPTGGYDYVAGSGGSNDLAKSNPALFDPAIEGGTLVVNFTADVNLDTITAFDVTIDLVLFDPALEGDA